MENNLTALAALRDREVFPPGSGRPLAPACASAGRCPPASLPWPHMGTQPGTPGRSRTAAPCSAAANPTCPDQTLTLSTSPLRTPGKADPAATPSPSTPMGSTGLARSRPSAPLPPAADPPPPTAVFGAAVRGEIPRLPGPTPQFALIPASSHAGLSSCRTPRAPSPPLPGDRCVRQPAEPGSGTGRAGGARSRLRVPRGRALHGPPPSWSAALPKHVRGGRRSQSPGPAAPDSRSRQRGGERTPRSTPATHLRLRSSPGRRS